MKTLTLLNVPITTLAEGKAFIEELHAQDALFHFEDNPEDIITENETPLFTTEQALIVQTRVDELFELNWSEAGHECPIGYALEIMNKEEQP